MGDGSEPVEDDELLFRRVLVAAQRIDPVTGAPSPQAFHPHPTADRTGISLSRARYKTREQAGQGRPGNHYFVATLRAGDLRTNSIRVQPDPLPGDPGHCILPDLNSENRRSDRTQELERELAKLTLRVDGPFPRASPG